MLSWSFKSSKINKNPLQWPVNSRAKNRQGENLCSVRPVKLSMAARNLSLKQVHPHLTCHFTPQADTPQFPYWIFSRSLRQLCKSMYQCRHQGLAAARGADPTNTWSSLALATVPWPHLAPVCTDGMGRNGSQLQTPRPGNREEGRSLDLCLSQL